jgi:lysozyme family protein
MIGNFQTALAFVWRAGFDSPRDGYHVTPGDPGGGTKGGVIEATWQDAVRAGLVHGPLKDASDVQLSAVLKAKCWGEVCDGLPHGLDMLMMNGRMMSGHFPKLFQSCLGCMGGEVDGWIGPRSQKLALSREPETLIDAISGVHYAYLAGLDTWPRFGAGWATRLQAAQSAALALIDGTPIA